MTATRRHIARKFDKLLQKLDRRTGKELEAEPEYIKNGDFALAFGVPTKPLWVETFVEFRLMAVSLSVTRNRRLLCVSSRLSRRSMTRLLSRSKSLTTQLS